MKDLPVAVIGAGPIGLAAAAHLVRADLPVAVFEAGPSVGSHIEDWRHVRLFSPWHEVLDPVSVELLTERGWVRPALDDLPTGAQLLDDYLRPLVDVPEIDAVVHVDHRVTGIGRDGIDKTRTAGREDHPFVLTVDTPTGESRVLAKAVIDASGTWGQPNPLGSGGLAAVGEIAADDRIVRGLPDVLGADRARFAGKRVAVVGSGHSAQNVVRDLATLVRSDSSTAATWIIRSSQAATPLDRDDDLSDADESGALPARGALVSDSLDAVVTGSVALIADFAVAEVSLDAAAVTLISAGGVKAGPFDVVIACTGARPDLGLTRELRVDIDSVVEAPRWVAPLIDPNIHSCGSVPEHGATELRHPEAGFFIVGNKSYGRAPTFLLRTGYEQVRSVVASLS